MRRTRGPERNRRGATGGEKAREPGGWAESHAPWGVPQMMRRLVTAGQAEGALARDCSVYRVGYVKEELDQPHVFMWKSAACINSGFHVTLF